MKTIILLDYDNLKEAAQKLDVELDVNGLIDFAKSIHEDSEKQTVYAYININERLPHVKDQIADDLARCGCIVRSVVGDNYGINFIANSTQDMMMDALRSMYENETTNVIIISNSHKLLNLVTLLREKDITVETVFYGSQVDYDLAVGSTGFINLEEFIEDDDDHGNMGGEEEQEAEAENSESEEQNNEEDDYQEKSVFDAFFEDEEIIIPPVEAVDASEIKEVNDKGEN